MRMQAVHVCNAHAMWRINSRRGSRIGKHFVGENITKFGQLKSGTHCQFEFRPDRAHFHERERKIEKQRKSLGEEGEFCLTLSGYGHLKMIPVLLFVAVCVSRSNIDAPSSSGPRQLKIKKMTRCFWEVFIAPADIIRQ